MTDAIELAPLPKEEAEEAQSKVDGRNRYKIPDPVTGRPARWTRATTFAKVISATDNLQRWSERMVMKGLSERPDLAARVASLAVDPAMNRHALDAASKEAKTAAGAWNKADFGTLLHKQTELVDQGQLNPDKAGSPWGPMLRAYVEILRSQQIEVLPKYVEKTVVIQQYKIAGTLDRVVRMPNGQLWVADVKTGRDLSWAWGEIAIQIALYAHADQIWDWDAQEFLPMPDVNKNQGLVIHLPAEGDVASLYRVNIAAGWEAADLCERVRNWRAKSKNLAQEVVTIKVEDDGGLPARWVARIQAAKTTRELSLIWQEANRLKEWTPQLTELGKQRQAEIES